MSLPAGIQINAPINADYAKILTPEAMALVAKLHRAFEPRRQARDLQGRPVHQVHFRLVEHEPGCAHRIHRVQQILRSHDHES